jgi:PKD repeat protein
MAVVSFDTNLGLSGSVGRTVSSKLFYAQGRYWIFYYDGNVGFGFRSSTDLSTFSNFTFITNYGPGQQWDVVLDGTYVHYIRNDADTSTHWYYNRGTLSSAGTISWGTETTVTTNVSGAYARSICLDSYGNVLVAVNEASQPKVYKNANTNGTWATASGYPMNLGSTTASTWWPQVVPLASGKWYAIGVQANGSKAQGFYYDGSSVNTEANISAQNAYGANQWSARSYNGEVHFAYSGNTHVYYRKRASNGTWDASEESIWDAAEAHCSPAVSIDETNGDVYLFWAGYAAPNANKIFYKQKDGATWQATQTETTEAVAVIGWYGSTSRIDQNHKVLYAYDMGAGVPYTGRIVSVAVSAATDAPTASFTCDVTSGTAPLTVTFQDTSSDNPTSWSWNFDDGTAADTDQDPSHEFTDAGTYHVVLTATNANGSDASDATEITVSAPALPEASFTTNCTSGMMPLAVVCTDTSTNSPTDWAWQFGDGSTSTEQNPKHCYSRPGTYTLTLTTTNDEGSDSVSTTISVLVPTIDQTILFTGVDHSGEYQIGTLSINGNLAMRGEANFTIHNKNTFRPVWGQEIGIYNNNVLVNRGGKKHYLNGTNAVMFTSNFTLGSSTTSTGAFHIRFNRSRADTAECPLVLHTTSGTDYSIRLWLTATGSAYVECTAATGMNGTGGDETTHHACAVGEHDVVFTWDDVAGSYAFYLDNVLKDSKASGCAFAGGQYNLVSGHDGTANNYFQGYLYEMEVWNDDLSAAQVTKLYYGDIPHPLGNSIVACYTFSGIAFSDSYSYVKALDKTIYNSMVSDCDFFNNLLPELYFSNVDSYPGDKIWPEKLFGGTIYEVKEYNNGIITDNWYDVRCVGFSELLDRLIVAWQANQWTGFQLTNIVRIICNDLFSREGVYLAADPYPSPTLNQFMEEYQNGAKVMDDLAKSGERIWFVDNYRGLHFVPPTYYEAPIDVTDDSGTFSNFSVTRGKSDYINGEFLKGATTTAHEDQTTSVTLPNLHTNTTGSLLGYKTLLSPPVIIYTPSGGTPRYLKTQSITEFNPSLPCEVLWDYGSSHIYYAGNVPRSYNPTVYYGTFQPAEGSSVTVYWNISWDEIAYRNLPLKVAERKAIEPESSGRYERMVDEDSLTTDTDRWDAIYSDLNIFSKETDVIEFDTFCGEVQAGQFIKGVDVTQHDVEGDYLITSCNIIEVEGKLYQRHVSAQGGNMISSWLDLYKRIAGIGRTASTSSEGEGGGGGGTEETGGGYTPTEQPSTLTTDIDTLIYDADGNGNTLTAGATSDQIRTALSNCPVGQCVRLAAGTYTITGAISVPSGKYLSGRVVNDALATILQNPAATDGAATANYLAFGSNSIIKALKTNGVSILNTHGENASNSLVEDVEINGMPTSAYDRQRQVGVYIRPTVSTTSNRFVRVYAYDNHHDGFLIYTEPGGLSHTDYLFDHCIANGNGAVACTGANGYAESANISWPCGFNFAEGPGPYCDVSGLTYSDCQADENACEGFHTECATRCAGMMTYDHCTASDNGTFTTLNAAQCPSNWTGFGFLIGQQTSGTYSNITFTNNAGSGNSGSTSTAGDDILWCYGGSGAVDDHTRSGTNWNGTGSGPRE